jgi:hypothetical protein
MSQRATISSLARKTPWHVWGCLGCRWSQSSSPTLTISQVLTFAETRSVALERNACQRYRNILGWVQCQKSTQAALTPVFPTTEEQRDRKERDLDESDTDPTWFFGERTRKVRA